MSGMFVAIEQNEARGYRFVDLSGGSLRARFA
jgi:hypothetical protein